MINTKFIKKSVKFLALLSIIFFNINLNAKAQDTGNYRGLIIDEVKFDLNTIPKGVSITKSFNVTHDFEDRNRKIVLYTQAVDFTSNNVSGAPKFLTQGSLSPQASLSSWIKIEKSSVTLSQRGQKEEIKFTITVPNDAEPGGKYAAVLLSEKPDLQDILSKNPNAKNLALSRQIGPLVLLSTPGEIRPSLDLNSIQTQDIRGRDTNFFFNPPVSFITKFKNGGNIHLIPKGTIYIYKGNDYQKYVAKLDINEKNAYTLPNSTREFSQTWNESFITTSKEIGPKNKVIYNTTLDWDKLSKLRIGKYNVKVIYSYEGESNTHEMNISFWIVPWQLVLALSIFITLIIAAVSYKIFRKKEPSYFKL